MDENKLRQLLQSKEPGDKKRTWRCPNDNELAAYVDGQFAGIKKQRLESHFANCAWCLEILSFLGQTFPLPESVPGHLLTRARMLASNSSGAPRRWGWAVTAAAACIIIIVAFIGWRMRSDQSPVPPTDLVAQQQPVEPPVYQPTNIATPQPQTSEPLSKAKPTETRAPIVRGEDDRMTPTIVFPREGALINNTQQPLHWKSVADAVSYEVRIVTAEGDRVFSGPTNDTLLPLTAISGLQSGAKYYVKIVAHLSGGRKVESPLVSFHYAGP